ncbi:hypothetical protein [Ruminococcus sp.]|uniref:hypothetical protein n=1 Tax=Ruminococcus sp. TaxID=41978 RepID=UPI001B5F5E09|nr:hypothetical protein [Ruminococcus sp.]MBP5433820.1 hypothetical protein [Ruminococcus sp.]
MKRSIPVILTAVFLLTGCKGGEGNSSEITVVTTKADVTSAADTTSVTTATTSTVKVTNSATATADTTEVSTATSSEEAALIDAGIIPPELEDTSSESNTLPTMTDASGNNAPIELPIIPIT